MQVFRYSIYYHNARPPLTAEAEASPSWIYGRQIDTGTGPPPRILRFSGQYHYTTAECSFSQWQSYISLENRAVVNVTLKSHESAQSVK